MFNNFKGNVMKKQLGIFELFAGMGAQSRAIKNIEKDMNIKLNHLGISEWSIKAIIAHDLLNNGEQCNFEEYANLNIDAKEYMLEYLSKFTFSLDGENPYSFRKLSKWNYRKLRQLYIAMKRTKNLGSILDISAKDLPDNIGVLTYSFPCTSISTAGNQEGIVEGTPSGNLLEVKRILEEFNATEKLPSFLLMENVKALLNIRNKAIWDEFASFLESLGYHNTTMVLNAKEFGIPQSRDRVFCISELNGKKEINVEKKSFCPDLKEFLQVDNPLYLDEYKNAVPNNTPKRRIDYFDNTKKLNDLAHTMTISCVQDRIPNCGVFLTNSDGLLINNPQLDRDINGVKAAFRFVTPREQFKLMGYEFEDFDTLKNAGFCKGHIERLAGNSIVVPKLESIFSAIIKRISIKNRIKKAVATKTKKMKARVLRTIKKLKYEGSKINSHRVSKIAGISYVTARKYWKLLSSEIERLDDDK
jgi:DNA (cytosine-5)-methyltransferase 1